MPQPFVSVTLTVVYHILVFAERVKCLITTAKIKATETKKELRLIEGMLLLSLR